jgi:phosphosulfolactate synthase (CoM biosynthesis protein A)
LPEADIAVAEIERLLDAGASLIILERSLLDLTFETVNDTSFIDRLFSAIGRERLVFEAESVDQQMALLRMFGKDVNIGPNLAVEEVVNILEPARNGLGRREGFSLIAAELGRAAE